MPFKLDEDGRNRLIEGVNSQRKKFEEALAPLSQLDPAKPATFISIGGGELGDLAVTAAKRFYGGTPGGIRTVSFDRYQGFPAQDAADAAEVFNMMDGDLLERQIRKHVPDPTQPHAIYLEVEKIDTYRAYRLGTEEGYRIMSTPFSPLVCMDRHATKIMFDRLRLRRVDWAYADDDKGVHRVARDFGLPVIVKPVMTSSGHGTSIVTTKEQLDASYGHAVEHARGIGDQVIVEKYLPELKAMGTEVTQIVVRHFNESGKIVDSFLPPIEHKRPGAVYHESWLPAAISGSAVEACRDGAQKIADFMGGLGVYAVEQFVIGNRVYNNEVANRPHDTGLVTRWMLNMDEGGIQLTSTLGLQLNPFHLELARQGVYGVAHVVLAPPDMEGEVRVLGWDSSRLSAFQTKGIRGDFWYFGKPTAYAGRRMGIAIAFQRDLEIARRNAEMIAHYAEECISYGGS